MNVNSDLPKKKICFVALDIYPCLSGRYPVDRIGGAEVQQMFIGKGLRAKGYDVSYVTQDYGQPDIEVIDNLRVYKAFKPNAGLFGIRFLYPRLFKIWKALTRVNADVYYTRGAGFLPSILGIFSKIHKKKFIFAASSDANFIPEMLKLPTQRDKILYRYGLKRAAAIIVQSNIQKSLLWQNFKLHGTVIPNFCIAEAKHLQDRERRYILWVSFIRHMKRPMQFIRLAQEFPNEEFVMIGGPAASNQTLFEEVKRESATLRNLQFLRFQPFEQTEKYFDKCKVFVNTSVYEGFPNTFLQAWRRGIPVISYVDPDNVIKQNKLGIVVSSERELDEALRSFVRGPVWDPNRVIEYFRKNHSHKVIDKYTALLREI